MFVFLFLRHRGGLSHEAPAVKSSGADACASEAGMHDGLIRKAFGAWVLRKTPLEPGSVVTW